MTAIGLLIVSHNGGNLLDQCLATITHHCNRNSYSLIVVDNASDDEVTVEVLEKWASLENTTIVRNTVNKGYAQAVNSGLGYLVENQTRIEYLFIINQDIAILNDSCINIPHFMAQDTQIGICGPRLINRDGSIQNSCYAFPSIFKKLIQLLGFQALVPVSLLTRIPESVLSYFPGYVRYFALNYSSSEQPVEVPWITGAFMVVKMDVFNELSSFDERFSLYGEDMDFCLRARKLGLKVYYHPQARVLHHGGARPAFRSEMLFSTFFNSMTYFYQKHYAGMRMRILLALNYLEFLKEKRLFFKAGAPEK
ncbi:glycosyltransferase family 2 protein [candidate division CSSED10-310 bacterium]|uniref:Glycosyltransferase family 2 protein n=1 Tax=candidate division CSSED10-310 bacterium TaxID=2855610 RepID=A0ABV6YQV2_UNCC1